MPSERSAQRGLWEGDRLHLDLVGRGTFYGMLASWRGQLFRDANFAKPYSLEIRPETDRIMARGYTPGNRG